jgi:uncharacterized membrane protein
MFPEAASPRFVLHTVPNRSLDAAGRRWGFCAIAAATFAVASFAALMGAWPVMPFAGLEIALVAAAFSLVRRHDGDFERFEIGEHEVRLERREARSLTQFTANRPWARVVVEERGPRCTLRLAYAGRTVALGRLLSDEGRRALAVELRGKINVTAKQGIR